MSSPISNHMDRVYVSSCPVCNSASLSERFAPRGWTLSQCAECGVSFSNPQPSDRELGEIYGADYFLGAEDEKAARHSSELKRATASDYIAQLRDFSGKAVGKLLEVGSGSGDLLAEAAAQGFEVTGVEYSADACEKARLRVPDAVILQGELHDQKLGAGVFDFCIMADVIEHVRSPRKTLATISRLLKPGGVILIATPSTDSWSAKMMGRNWMEYKPEHLTYFGQKTMELALANAGFEGTHTRPGYKFVSLEYVIRHFEKFKVPGFTRILKALGKATPLSLRFKPLRVVASGLIAIARKSPDNLSEGEQCG